MATQVYSSKLAVDLATVRDPNDGDNHSVVFDLVDHAVVTDPNPHHTSGMPYQCRRSRWPGIRAQRRHGTCDSTLHHTVKFAEFTGGGRRPFDGVGHRSVEAKLSKDLAVRYATFLGGERLARGQSISLVLNLFQRAKIL